MFSADNYLNLSQKMPGYDTYSGQLQTSAFLNCYVRTQFKRHYRLNVHANYYTLLKIFTYFGATDDFLMRTFFLAFCRLSIPK